MRSFGVPALTLALALGGCATVQNVRARLVRPPVTCADQTVQIYFEPASADLTPEGLAVIRAAAANARGCQVRTVEVLGLSEAKIPQQEALDLSRRRAGAVSAALRANGLPPGDFQVGAAGAEGALTPGGMVNPLRRRVDVTLRLQPR